MSDVVERAEMYLGFIDPYSPWEADTPALGGPWHVYAADSHKAICVDGATASFVAAAPDVMRELIAEVKQLRDQRDRWRDQWRRAARKYMQTASALNDTRTTEMRQLCDGRCLVKGEDGSWACDGLCTVKADGAWEWSDE